MKRCFLLLIDGLRPDVAEAELAAGRLPALAEMIARDGGLNRAVTAFPSTTSVSYLPFLTGCLPGTCNVPSIRWLDRAAYQGRWWRERHAVRSYCGYQAGLLDRDLRPTVRTIFELVPESIAFFTMISRGLTPERDPTAWARKFWGSVAHYAMWHQPSDTAVGRHLLQAVDGPWRFFFAQFPAVDGYTHQSTPDAPRVLRALQRVDATIRRLRRRLAERGELDDSLILVVSDHGATPVHTHLDLAQWFRDQRVPTMSHPILWTRRPRAAVMVAGNGSAMVYARPDEARQRRWPVQTLRTPEAFGTAHDLIGRLVEEPAVAFVFGASEEGGAQVVSAAGEAEVTVEGTAIRYRPVTGDPLELGGERVMEDREWLNATFETSYPDVLRQILDQLASPRAGDLIVVSRAGYDFRRRWEIPEHKSGHGSMHGLHMHIPLWTSHPGPTRPIRSVDLFPAMLAWLGADLPKNLDGELLWNPLERLLPVEHGHRREHLSGHDRAPAGVQTVEQGFAVRRPTGPGLVGGRVGDPE